MRFIRKKKYLALGIAAVALIMMSGCGYSKEEKELMATYEKVAKINAVNYIEEKYGFTPEIKGTTVLKVDSGPVPNFFPNPTGMINVRMMYEGYEFTVNISGEESTTEGRDDYQRDQIAEAFKKTLSDELGIDIVSIDVRYTENNYLENVFTDVDSLLEELRESNLISVVVKTMDDISEDTVGNITYDRVELLVVSCENQQCLDVLAGFEYLNEQNYRLNFYNIEYMNNKLREYSLFMKGHVFRNEQGVVSYVDYAHKKAYDNMYFTYDRQNENGEVNVSVTTNMAPEMNWSKASGKAETLPTFTSPKKVSDSYAIDFGEHQNAQVYINKNNVQSVDKASMYVALQYINEDGREIYTHIAALDVGDYYSFTLEKQDKLRFALMINKE